MSIVAAVLPTDYTPPGIEDFWIPLIGEGAWAFTRASLLAIVSVGLLWWWLHATTKRRALVPSKGQMSTEAVYNFVRNDIARDLIGSKEFMRFVPFLFSLFVFILINNLFGVVPPFQNSTNARIGFPAALTIIVFVMYHWLGIKKHGFIGYWKSLVPAGLPKPMVPAIFFLEFITDIFTRPVTLALRLFGNMFAGHIMMLLFIGGGWYMLTNGGIILPVAGGVTWIMAVVMTVFELVVEVLQAYVFTLLAALYIGGALADEH